MPSCSNRRPSKARCHGMLKCSGTPPIRNLIMALQSLLQEICAVQARKPTELLRLRREVGRERLEVRVADLGLAKRRHDRDARANERTSELRQKIRALLE